jgi:phosphoribosylanthranilate isomerase
MATHHRTRIKVCGITRSDDVRVAADAGVDAIGLVFYPQSPRYVAPAQAHAITTCLPPFVTTVALFVNPMVDEVQRVIDTLPIDCLQFHGDEPAAFCQQFGRPYIKAIRVHAGTDILTAIQRYATAAGVLLDAFQQGVYGGTGQTFDWSSIPANLSKPLILAGGLNSGNVAAAILQVLPYAVDVSGGVEASKGIKDHAKMRAFIQEVHAIDCR